MRKKGFFQAHQALVWVVAATALFLLWRVSSTDMVGDNAHYTLRALGYIDMMFSDRQTTPLHWFNNYPWWANLSFHDHPPLLFAVQHLFLALRESVFFAKLPYIFFSLGSLVLLYAWLYRERGKSLAIWAAASLGVNSLFLWTGRAGFMEAGVIFFVLLTTYAFFIYQRNKTSWWFFGLALGLSLLAKLNTLFLIPTIVLYLVWKKRDYLRRRETYLAFLLALVIFSPYLIYNFMMVVTTGHFDYQFSRLFGQETPWDAGGVGVANPLIILFSLLQLQTIPYAVLAFGGLALGLYWRQAAAGFATLAVLCLTIQYIFTGAGAYHLAIFTPFLALGVASFIIAMARAASTIVRPWLWPGAAVLLFVYLLAIAINSHILIKHPLPRHPGWTSVAATSDNVGIYQLDKFLDDLIDREGIHDIRDGYGILKAKTERLARYRTSAPAARLPGSHFAHMIVYDENINWSVELWPFNRRRFYHNLPILSTKEFQRFSAGITIDRLYYIQATPATFLENTLASEPALFEQVFIDSQVEPERIYRSDGQEVFRVYTSSKDTKNT